MDCLLVKTTFGTLDAADPETQQYLRGLGAGEILKAKITRPRNIKFFRKYFALLGLVWENAEQVQEQFGTFDKFRKAVIIEAGYYDVVPMFDGTNRIEPMSISWAKMDEKNFGELYIASVDALQKYVHNFSTMDRHELEQEVMKFMGNWSA